MSSKLARMSFQERLDHFISTIRTEIVGGLRKPGTYLPSESTMAKQFQLSNKSVRKGLELLVEEGLIVKIDRVGSMVTETARQIITLNFGYNSTLNEDFVLGDLLAEFQRLHPYIYVRAIPMSVDEHVKLVGEMMSNGLLDVVSLNSVQFQELAEAGMTSMLEPLEEVDGLYPITSEAFRVGEEYFVRPISFSPVVLCYNKAHFAEAGIPEPDSYWTWEDLLQAARRISEVRGKHSIYFVPASENRYPIFLLQGGMQMEMDEGGQIRIGEKMAESLRLYSRLVKDHTIFPKYFADRSDDETIQLFAQEQVSIIITTHFNMNAFNQLQLPYDVCPIPGIHRGDPQKTLLITIGAGISHNSREKEAARTLVDFLASAEAQQIIRDRTVSIPALRAAAEAGAGQEHLNRPSRTLFYRELFPTFKYHHEIGLPIRAMKTFSRSLKAYWSEMIDETMLQEHLKELIVKQLAETDS
ncbi:extracellular solute-binding protein [Paenibacillus sp. GCM10027626]|uniref:extracellular solute-binding protein n=1 Tax=Paenibacillus sp. GCM10027626 TaxID=3273411 RepID=UPI0036278FFF